MECLYGFAAYLARCVECRMRSARGRYHVRLVTGSGPTLILMVPGGNEGAVPVAERYAGKVILAAGLTSAVWKNRLGLGGVMGIAREMLSTLSCGLESIGAVGCGGVEKCRACTRCWGSFVDIRLRR